MKKLVIVDISSFIFRAFFAVRSLHAADGTPVNSVYGVLSMLLKLMEKYGRTHIVLAQDRKGPSFRKEIYEDYKANRGAPPEDLIPQFELLDKLFELMDIPRIGREGFEADDIIGSLVTQYRDDFDQIDIISGDKDLMQFIDDKVFMVDSMKNKSYGVNEVFEKMGVNPSQMVDYLSLVGDASDNIPGVKGIGAKGAAKLLAEYKNLETCLDNAEEIKNKRVREGLLNYKDDALLSKKLVQIITDIDLNTSVDELDFDFNPSDDLYSFLEELNFKALIKKIKQFEEIEAKLESSNEVQVKVDWVSIKNLDDLNLIKKESVFCYPIFREDQVISFYLHQEKFYQVHIHMGLSEKDLLNTLHHYDLVGFNLKSLWRRFFHYGLELPGSFFDLSLASFLAQPDWKMSEDYLYSAVLDIDLPQIDSDLLTSQDAYYFKCLEKMPEFKSVIEKKLEEVDQRKLYDDLEAPVSVILANMENQGISLDLGIYLKIEIKLAKELEEIQNKINELGGEGINLRSPKQVGQLLFEKLELPVIKKTKTGYSTNVDVLEKLKKMEVSDIPGLLLDYREIDKLLSTYVRALPEFINIDTKRIHPNFNQVKAATGRLSCDQPNLQNIPIKTERGRLLRSGFCAKEGHTFLAADYSQIELRILAHFSEDPTMMKAFNENVDIHSQTASEVFGVPLNEVSRSQRSSAKAINFGLMFGQGAFGLSQQLEISRKEASDYIKFYFERFSKVKAYLDTLKDDCIEKGFSETLMGRKRYISSIKSSNHQERASGERLAINSPIQGSAADLIKQAMIQVNDSLQRNDLKSKILLQIHDELILEVPLEEEARVSEILKEEMESAMKRT